MYSKNLQEGVSASSTEIPEGGHTNSNDYNSPFPGQVNNFHQHPMVQGSLPRTEQGALPLQRLMPAMGSFQAQNYMNMGNSFQPYNMPNFNPGMRPFNSRGMQPNGMMNHQNLQLGSNFSPVPRPIQAIQQTTNPLKESTSPQPILQQQTSNQTLAPRSYPQPTYSTELGVARPPPVSQSNPSGEFIPKPNLNSKLKPSDDKATELNYKEVVLAKDAIRYDDSSHKRQLVATYRYKDMKYQEIISAAKQRSTPPKNPPVQQRPLPPVTLVYDRDTGSAFFRHLPRLQEKLDGVGVVPETLVPIRLDIEAGGMSLSDAFTWNLHDDFINVETFAEGLCRDLQLPAQLFRDSIVESIRCQLLDYAQHGQEGTKAIESLNEQVICSTPAKLSQLTELRILIKLDITVGRVSLVDQFEWDILCPLNSPERFAAILSADLGLGGEFT